jgi:Fe-S-cluster containining protein
MNSDHALPLVQIRTRTDKAIEAFLQGKTVSCKAGCAACCKILVHCSLAEAMDIVEQHFGQVRELRPRLQELSSRLMSNADMTAYYGTRCVFLDGNDRCSIYEHRPMVCRTHYAESPAEDCAAGPRGKVKLHDTRTIMAEATVRAMEASTQPHCLLPIPMAILVALDALDAIEAQRSALLIGEASSGDGG